MKLVLQLNLMGMDNVAEFFRNKTILVTGATGFLAKVFVEKILRTQPSVNKLYLLIRASDAKSATERLRNEIINKELFRVLRDSCGSQYDLFISSKVIAVPGDMSFDDDLGVNDSKLREEMVKEIEIVVNVAANTNFFGRYDVSLAINTFGTLNLLSFVKKCDKIKLILHTSTAYICGEQAGIITEKPFYMGETLKQTCKLDINEEKRIVQEKLDELKFQGVTNEAIDSELMELGLQRANLHGWPNTYVFTKAMGEMILGEFEGDLPIVIIRPTMIASTIKEPFPGWIQGARTIDGVIVSYAKGKLACFPANPKTVMDVIPADMVVNAMIVAMTLNINHRSYRTIYHISSSLKNPLTFQQIHEFSYLYFTKNPLIDRDGKRIKVHKAKLLTSADRFYLYMKIKYMLPVKVLHWVSLLCKCFKEQHKNLDHKIKLAMRLAHVYIPYVYFKGIFDDTNLEKLQQMAQERGIDQSVFNFDSKSIDWEDYIMNRHIPGLTKHVIKP